MDKRLLQCRRYGWEREAPPPLPMVGEGRGIVARSKRRGGRGTAGSGGMRGRSQPPVMGEEPPLPAGDGSGAAIAWRRGRRRRSSEWISPCAPYIHHRRSGSGGGPPWSPSGEGAVAGVGVWEGHGLARRCRLQHGEGRRRWDMGRSAGGEEEEAKEDGTTSKRLKMNDAYAKYQAST